MYIYIYRKYVSFDIISYFSVPVTDPKVSILRQFAPATDRRDRGTDRQLGAFITTPLPVLQR